MAIQIKNDRGIFRLIGWLNRTQVYEIRSFFEAKIRLGQDVVISIENLDQLDLSGAMCLCNLEEEAFKYGVNFRLIGLRNQRILGSFRMINKANLLQL